MPCVCGKPVICHEDRAQSLRHGLFSLWQQQELLDFTLHIGKNHFKVHKVVLAATSDHFRPILAKNSQDNSSKIKGLSATAVERVVFFIYANSITLLKDTVHNITEAAKYFQIPALIEICNQFKEDGEYSSEDNVLVKGIHSLWQKGHCFDFTISSEGSKFRVHRVVLCAMSTYIKNKTSDIPERDRVGYQITGASANAFKILLKFIYSGKMDVTTSNSPKILETSTLLEIASATASLSESGVSKLNNANWMTTASGFWSCELPRGLSEVADFASMHLYDKVAPNEIDIHKLEFGALKFIVEKWKGLDLDLFLFLHKWVELQTDLSEAAYTELLYQVRFCLLPPMFLIGIYEKPNLYRGSLINPMQTAIKYHKLPMHKRVLDTTISSQVRGEPTFLIFRNMPHGFVLDLIEGEMGACRSLTPPPGYMISYKYLEINNFLVFKLTQDSDVVWSIFDPRTTEWLRIADPPHTYLDVSMTHDDKYMYLAGGVMSDLVSTDQVARYSFKTNKWKIISKLPLLLNSHSVCYFNNSLYVSGGFPDWFRDTEVMTDYDASASEKVALRTLYQLDLTTFEWEIRAPMRSQHYKHSSHILTIESRKMLCILNRDLSIECYNLKKDQWSLLRLRFNTPAPTMGHDYWEARGNKIFLAEAYTEGKELTELTILTIPERGRNADLVGHIYDADRSTLINKLAVSTVPEFRKTYRQDNTCDAEPGNPFIRFVVTRMLTATDGLATGIQ